MDDQNQNPQNQPTVSQPAVSPTPTVDAAQTVNPEGANPVTPQTTNLPTENTVGIQETPANTTPNVIVSDHSPVNQNGQVNPKKSHKLIILAVIVAVLIVGLGSVYALYLHKPKTVTFTKVYTGTASNSSTKASVTAPVTSTASCGSANCFNQKFTACSPATYNSTALGTTVKYQIYGPKGGGCSMQFEYSQVANAAWQNQPMTCNYNNKESLENASQDVMNDLFSGKNTYSCTGPLVAILQSQSSGSN